MIGASITWILAHQLKTRCGFDRSQHSLCDKMNTHQKEKEKRNTSNKYTQSFQQLHVHTLAHVCFKQKIEQKQNIFHNNWANRKEVQNIRCFHLNGTYVDKNSTHTDKHTKLEIFSHLQFARFICFGARSLCPALTRSSSMVYYLIRFSQFRLHSKWNLLSSFILLISKKKEKKKEGHYNGNWNANNNFEIRYVALMWINNSRETHSATHWWLFQIRSSFFTSIKLFKLDSMLMLISAHGRSFRSSIQINHRGFIIL